MWRPAKADSFLFLTTESLNAPSFIAHSGAGFKPNFHIVPCDISGVCEPGSDPSRGEPAIPASVGEGGGGPGGPRTGNSSGIWPGNSSGLGGSPGSCNGGGTSGRGLPGGFSCGGSVGCPGLIDGSSCGSIGILLLREIQSANINGAAAAMFPRVASSGRVADRLDMVAVRIEHERAVIIGMIMRPDARRAVV